MTKNLNEYPNLLAPGASEWEIDAAKLALYAMDNDIDFKPLLNPKTCKASHLPYLAHLVGLPVWDEEWTVEKQRQVVEKWPTILKYAGDKWAVVEALRLIGIEPDHEWWHEQAPLGVKFTFKITAWVSDNIYEAGSAFINPKVAEWVDLMVQASKSAHDHYKFIIGAKLNGGINIVGAMRFTNKLSIAGDETKPTIQGQLNIAAAMRFKATLKITGVEA